MTLKFLAFHAFVVLFRCHFELRNAMEQYREGQGKPTNKKTGSLSTPRKLLNEHK